jgi:hypothetical protein
LLRNPPVVGWSVVAPWPSRATPRNKVLSSACGNVIKTLLDDNFKTLLDFFGPRLRCQTLIKHLVDFFAPATRRIHKLEYLILNHLRGHQNTCLIFLAPRHPPRPLI